MIRKAIPNLFTLANLFCGALGIVMAFHEKLIYASILICIAAVFDFLDGFIARAVKGQSEMGKELDSLADMVTFGLLPGIMLFQLITASYSEYFTDFDERAHVMWALIGFLIPLFSALRLAKFNVDTKQSEEFLGLPTPASALLIASIPMILEWQFRINYYQPPVGAMFETVSDTFRWDAFERFVVKLLLNPAFYQGLAVVLSALMVLRFPLLAFKFKSFSWKDNKARYLFLMLVGLCVLSLFVPYWRFVHFYFPQFEYTIIPIILILYLIVSLINNLLKRVR